MSSQAASGGLRDKPGKPADGYHTLYNLSGLSSAQHHVYRTTERRQELAQKWVPPIHDLTVTDTGVSDETRIEFRRNAFIASMAWTEEEGASRIVGGKPNRVVCPSLLPFHGNVLLLWYVVLI